MRSTGRLLAGLVSATVGAVLLAGCGQKGALYLPEVANSAAPAASANASSNQAGRR